MGGKTLPGAQAGGRGAGQQQPGGFHDHCICIIAERTKDVKLSEEEIRHRLDRVYQLILQVAARARCSVNKDTAHLGREVG